MKRILLILSISLLAMNVNAQQNSDFTEMVRYASKAPSGHNTQPWKFKFVGDTITILPNLVDALPVVDGSHRELFISLGCATENLCIAATHFGYRTKIVSQSEQGIVIAMEKSDDIRESPLFQQIEKRQTNRSVYHNRKIPKDTLDIINDIPLEQSVHLYFMEIGSPLADTLIQYIAKGNEIQMNDKAFKRELMDWMRFNKKQINEKKDGLTYQALGVPSMPGFLSKPMVGMFLKPGKQNKTDLQKINSSSHLILITTENNTPKEWIDLGRTLERFLLATTGLGIANAYMNQPCEVAPLAKEIQQSFPINQEFPTLIVRVGYADPMPYSPRKEVESIIE